MRKFLTVLLVTVLLVTTCGCNPFQKPQPEDTMVVNVYVAKDLIPESVFEKFEDETGVRVKCYDLKDTETAITKLKTGLSPFDLIIADNLTLEQFAASGAILKTLDMKQLPDADCIAPEVREALPESARPYLLPYMRTCAVLLHDVGMTQSPVTSFDSMWSPTMKNRVVTQEDARLLTATALKRNGNSVNTTNTQQLEDAKQALCTLKENTYNDRSNNVGEDVAQGKGSLAVVWAKDADAAYAMNENLEVLYPQEGTVTKMTCMAVSESAPHSEHAYALMNFLLQGENCVTVSKYLHMESLNTKIADYADDAYYEMMAVYMAGKYTETAECLHYVQDDAVYDEIWRAYSSTKKTEEVVD